MCLSLTPIGVRHAVDVVPCPNLPTEKPYLLLPLPGAPPYHCASPCGIGTCRFVSTLPAPPPMPRTLRLSLRLAPTLAALLAAALAGREPVGTADEAHLGPAAYGCLRYYRN